MKLSPIQLQAYALTELSYRANQSFDNNKPTTYKESDLVVTCACRPAAGKNLAWEVAQSIRLQPSEKANAPYYVSLQITGVFRLHPKIPTDRIEAIVRFNGSTVLFGISREILRNVTAAGPFPQLLLPTVDFRTEEPPKAEAESSKNPSERES